MASAKRRTRRALLAAPVVAAGAAVAVAAGAPSRGATQAKHVRRVQAPAKLIATVNPSGQTTLTDGSGRASGSLRSGWYAMLVHVNSASASFQLTGPKLRRVTPARFVGITMWGVHLFQGSYRYGSGRHALSHTHLISVR